jgi:hypothetical protein
LEPFGIGSVRYLKPRETVPCRRMIMPLATAPTGNYNEAIINGLRELYVGSFRRDAGAAGDRTHIW